MIRFGKAVYKEGIAIGKESYWFRFNNNYGASVVKSEHSNGKGDSFWSLTVLEFDGDFADFAYNTGITSDEIHWLNDEGVEKLLNKIEALKEDNYAFKN